jgi:hypothetical protein
MRRTTPCSSRIWSVFREVISMRFVKVSRVRAVVLACAMAIDAVPAAAQHARDSSFAGLVARLSEPNGYFDSDNIITNEASYLQIASQLRKVGTHGGVYLGVGPDQNFSYVALIRPEMAFMIDVRRDNLLEHLLFKSIFAMARNRAEYLCLLLGKPTPVDVARWAARPTTDILAYVSHAPTDSAVVAATRRSSNGRIAALGVSLDTRDRQMIDRYRAEFIDSGLDTRYSSLGRNNRLDYPSLGELIMATDREGHRISYLADETAYQYVRDMEAHDRIVPIVGNVAGVKAVRAIGEYSAEHHLKVSAFYLSNVEQYLLTREGGFPEFARNVGTLPHDSTSVIIRSYFGRLGRVHPLYVPSAGNVSTSMIEPIDSFLRRYANDEIRNYADLVFNGFITP